MTNLLNVTPEDRELLLLLDGVTDGDIVSAWVVTKVRAGEDDNLPKLQAIARHRLEGEADARRYRQALERIDAAVLLGRVCDDVAWFGPAQTLHDFIQSALNQPAALADLFPPKSAA